MNKIEQEEAGAKRTKVMICACNNEYQDSTYGKHNRVHNQTKNGWRCTVCGNNKSK